MNPVATQKAALDNALVLSKRRLTIERCNAIIAFSKPQKEETYQVTLDALNLSPCYPAFQIVEFDKLLRSFIARGTLKFVSKTEDYQIYGAVIPDGMINDDIKLSTGYKTYLDYATRKVPPKKARKFKKPASPKLKTENPSFTLKDYEEEAQDEEYVFSSEKDKSDDEETMFEEEDNDVTKELYRDLNITQGLRDTDLTNAQQEKAPAKTGRGKGTELLSDVALLEEAQMKKTLKKSNHQTHNLLASGSSEGAYFESDVPDEPTGKTKDTSKGTGVKPRVLDVSKDDSSKSNNDSWGDSEDESDDDHDEDDNDEDDGNDDDSEKDESDDEETMFEEEDNDVTKELYRDLNITQGLRDTDLTNAQQDSTTTTYPTTTLPEIPNIASLFQFDQRVSALETKVSEFNQTSQFAKVVSLIPSIVDNYLASKLKEEVNVAGRLQSNKLKEEAEAENQEFINQVDSTMKQIIKEQVKAQVSKIMPQIEKYVTESLGAKVLVRSTNQPQISYAVAASLSESELKKILINKIETNKSINRSEEPESEAADTEMHQDQGNKSGHIDDQPNNKAAPQHDCTIAKECYKERQPSCTFDELMGTPIDFLAFVMNCLKIDNLTQEILVGPAFNLLKGTYKSIDELEFHFKECYKAVNNLLDWHNPKGREYMFGLSKPVPLIEDQGRQVVHADYFINNDLEYLKGGSSSSKYATSTTRTKAVKYDNIKGIEDMVPRLWNPVKVAYNKHDKSPHDVYSKRRIIAVTIVKVIRWYDYGYLGEIVVRRDDNVLNKFKEGDFPRHNLRDIDDMLLLLVQKKLSNLDVDDRRVVHDIASNIDMDYLPKRHWSNMEMKRYHIMVKVINKLLFERTLMCNLEKFVGRRDYGNDLRLLDRTI
uniref:Uncharacterized protein n=1 Tax=Tanacetum cinerariifolium TaxID=118510 RepID=A0A6L2K7C0_TANCI|nr:hypothetical protein [Tanacetum cinerariifolium]